MQFHFHTAARTYLCRDIYFASELRVLLLQQREVHGASAALKGASIGVECEKKAKTLGWRRR